METRPSNTEVRALCAWSEAVQERRELHPQEIVTLVTVPRGPTEEDIELIEMRYQQMLALANLEVLFADGQLDRM